MKKLIKPTEKWTPLPQLERLCKKEKDALLAKKLNAIRLLMKGYQLKEVAAISDVCTNTIKNWRDGWNKGHLEGLRTKYKGSASIVDEQMRADIKEVVLVRHYINGQIVTGKLMVGYLKKNTKSH